MRRGHRDHVQTGDFTGERVFASRADVRYVLHTAIGMPGRAGGGFASPRRPANLPATGGTSYCATFRATGCSCSTTMGRAAAAGAFLVPRATPGLRCGRLGRELIERIADELGVERARMVTIGSSMGGWAALYFGAGSVQGTRSPASPRRGSAATVRTRVPPHRGARRGRSSPEDSGSSTPSSSTPCAPPPRLRTCTSTAAGRVPTDEGHVAPLLAVLNELGAAWSSSWVTPPSTATSAPTSAPTSSSVSTRCWRMRE